ncbi:MAG TPA: DUF979 domain-containing protein [Steroidobacteraceae bacterium]|nr:DUF979 domain-containing protein [Steroidobacteraceae bacterium]
MIGLAQVYALAGVMFAGFALLSLRDRTHRRRSGTACFWGLLALSFLAGSRLGDFANGVLVIALALLAGTGAIGRGVSRTTSAEVREARARARGNCIFVAPLLIPVIAICGTLVLGRSIDGVRIADPSQVTLVALALGILLALCVAIVQFRPPALAPLEEGRRLADTIGWAAVLPQMLAALGAVFALSGVGTAVGNLATAWLPLEHPLVAVTVYCVGMALLTVVMGNAFAAFPVMTAAIGVPLIIHGFGGNPAIVGAIGMLSGFCGTLTTPMAANFNMVPAALLELPGNAVIRVQIPTAVPMLLCNVVLMYLLAFRF